MASTGIAYRNNRYIITNNPASLSAMDNQFFAGEIGVNGQYIDYSGNGVSRHESPVIRHYFQKILTWHKNIQTLGKCCWARSI